jgi:hypothetical protein
MSDTTKPVDSAEPTDALNVDQLDKVVGGTGVHVHEELKRAEVLKKP